MTFTPAFLDEVRARTSVEAVVERVVKLQRSGRKKKGLCPFHREKTPSFYVEEARGSWRCYGCGAGGDAIDFVMRTGGLDFPDAVRWLAADAGLAEDPDGGERRALRPVVQRPSADELDAAQAKEVAKARGIWRQAVPADASPAGAVLLAYLRGRGITLAPPPTLRVVARMPYWIVREGAARPTVLHEGPAMVAPLQAADGLVMGVHVTWLANDGTGKARLVDPRTGEALKAKKVRGAPWGCAVRLAPAASAMGAAEGIETALSVMQATGLPVWAAYSLGNLAGGGDRDRPSTPHPERPGAWVPTVWPDPDDPGMPWPDACRDRVLIGDGDSDPHITAALLERAARRGRAAGCRVRIAMAPHGADFNDLLRGAA